MNVFRTAMLAVLSIIPTVSSAQTAKVVPVTGEIFVSSGAGYRPIAGEFELKPGDSVIASVRAKASLFYSDGCAVDVMPGMVAWVEPASPCDKKSGGGRDPEPTLSAPKAFDPAWLVDGTAMINRHRNPAGP